MPLIKGSNLTDKQRAIVLSAYIYRWTTGNSRRAEVYAKIGSPKIPLQSDETWLAEHAFHFVKDGSRLNANHHYAEPAFLAD
jgi:hypothetical protein